MIIFLSLLTDRFEYRTELRKMDNMQNACERFSLDEIIMSLVISWHFKTCLRFGDRSHV